MIKQQRGAGTTHQIHLIRHGRSAHSARGWFNADGFRAWRESYEQAGIVDEPPPPRLRRIVESSGLVVSSDARRAVESAQRLRSGTLTVSPLVRELELAAPGFIGVVLPLPAWALAVGLRSAFLRLFGLYPCPVESARIESATRWLIELAEDHEEIAVITHASFRTELARCLSSAGWSSIAQARSLRPWSCWSFHWPARAQRSSSTTSGSARV